MADDSRTLGERRFDVAVVGSGAAGGWAAKELTEQGLTVLLLEAGRSIRPETDFPLPAPSEGRLWPRLKRGLIHQAIQARCPAFNARTGRFFVDDLENPYTTPPDKPFNWFRGRQVGGRLHAWGRVVVRLSDVEFKGASRDGSGVDWPIAYADLAPFYERVERFLGVQGSTDGVAAVPDGAYVEGFAMTPAEVAFKAAIESAFPDRRVIAARVVKHDQDRVPATIRAAERTGRLVLRSDAVVHRLIVDPRTGAARGVAFVDRTTKQPAEARANVVVLCASTIESVRILLNSASARHPGGLGDSSGRLGRGLMDHVLVGLAGPAPLAPPGSGASEAGDPYDFGRGTGFYIPPNRNAQHAHPALRRGYAVQGGIGRGPNWYLLAHGAMVPRAENRISVNPNRHDAWGIPVAHLDCSWSANETAMIDDAAIALPQMAATARLQVRVPPAGGLLETLAFRAARSRLLAPSGAFLPGSAIHELGGAAMGHDPATSVLNAFGQCWDAPNVFVTDGACFPSGCSQNITLTIMALTVRASEHLANEYRAGRL